jgi:hypothetical protein
MDIKHLKLMVDDLFNDRLTYMMLMDIKHLKLMVDDLFNDRLTYMMLLQELAENFYPERADFTSSLRT